MPGARVSKAYNKLWLAENGTEEQKKKLGRAADLPRPWDPATCLDAKLRNELWVWLDWVAEWINAEYVWEASGGSYIPDCWPLHPHLVHELAVLADQRRRAGLAANSDPLETWHRVMLPNFFDRTRQRLKQSCDDDHQPWPARSRYSGYGGENASARRLAAFDSDVAAARQDQRARAARTHPVSPESDQPIDLVTGEVLSGGADVAVT